jgi:hypothetical protein
MGVHICIMQTPRLNIRLDRRNREIIEAILEEVERDPSMLPSDLTKFVNKACKLLIDAFRKRKRYRAIIERTEKRVIARTQEESTKRGPIPMAPRKNVQSVRFLLGVGIKPAEQEINNEVA